MCVAQRRNPELDDIQLVIQVLPKLARVQPVGEGIVAGRDQAYIYAVAMGRANG